MKSMKYLILGVVIVLGIALTSDDNSSEGLLGMSKEEFIISKLELVGEQKTIFVTAYQEYSARKAKVTEKGQKAIQDLSKSMSDVNLDIAKMSKSVASIRAKINGELETTYKGLVPMIGKRSADKFLLVEGYLNNLEYLMMMEKLPILQPGIVSGKVSSSVEASSEMHHSDSEGAGKMQSEDDEK